MKESHYRKFMAGLYAVFLVIFGCLLVDGRDDWRKILTVAVIFTVGYFWIVNVACKISRAAGGFAAESPPNPDAPKKAN